LAIPGRSTLATSEGFPVSSVILGLTHLTFDMTLVIYTGVVKDIILILCYVKLSYNNENKDDEISKPSYSVSDDHICFCFNWHTLTQKEVSKNCITNENK